VTDTGIGIAVDKLDTIFDPYTQAKRSDAQIGTGLGLHICYQLVALMGGTLEVISEVGTGSAFFFTIPFVRTDTLLVCDSDDECSPTHPLSDQPILVIDDDLVNRILLVAMLEPMGYNVSTAANGQDALDLMKCNSFCVILTDTHMPGMDGFEFVRTVRKDESTRPDDHARNIIISISADATDTARNQCMNCGMDGLLPKPISQSALCNELSHHLSRNQL